MTLNWPPARMNESGAGRDRKEYAGGRDTVKTVDTEFAPLPVPV